MAIKKLKSDFVALKPGEVIDSIVALESGAMVVTSHILAASGKVSYYERLYSTAFVLQGPVKTVATAEKSTAPKLSQAVDAKDGTYWVLVYSPPATGETLANVRGQHFAADGTKLGGLVDIDALEGVSERLAATVLGTGDVALPIAQLAFQGAVTPQLVLETFDSAFNSSGTTPILTTAGGAKVADVAGTGSQKVFVTWLEEQVNGIGLHTTVLNLDGSTVLSPMLVKTGDIVDAEIDNFADGGFVVTYREKIVTSSAPNGVRLVSKIYDASGTLLGTAANITRFEKVYGKDFETVAMSDGRFAVLWVTDDHINPAKANLFLQYFNQAGDAISGEILIGHVPRTGVNLHAELNAAGKLVVNWTGLNGAVKSEHTAVYDPLKFVATDERDQWFGTANNETFDGKAGNDWLYGAGGTDKISGGLGSDEIGGGEGADVLNGGSGFDFANYFYDEGVTVSLVNPGANKGFAAGDTFTSIEGLLGSESGNDRLTGDAGDNTLYGNGGDDSLVGGKGDDWLIGGAGADRLNGGSGTDLASYNEDKGVTVYLDNRNFNKGAAAGDEFISIENLRGSKFADRLYGTDTANKIFGMSGNDLIAGGFGNDRLEGDAGSDRLYGEDGDDELWGGTGADALVGGDGFDFADYFNQKSVTLSLARKFASGGAAKGDTFSGIEGVYGSSTGNDKIGGNALGNSIFGFGGNDRLFGEAGDDALLGGKGADVLDGGAGEDWADYYQDSGVKVSLDGSIAATGAAKGDRFVSIEDLGGSRLYADTLIGNSKDNYLAGNGGNDHLIGRNGNDGLKGGKGKDILEGGAGEDYFVYSNVSEVGDTITDFEKKDYFSFSSENFGFVGSGYLPDAYFASGKNFPLYTANTGGPASFFFRTTDDTLWVNWTTGLKLVANLDISFDLTAADIYMY